VTASRASARATNVGGVRLSYFCVCRGLGAGTVGLSACCASCRVMPVYNVKSSASDSPGV
jgi:hypothetical protein